MGAPKKMLEAMRNDAQVLALVAVTDNAPFTYAVIDAVANWFDDVEIRYPIAEMAFTDAERRKLVRDVSDELLALFNQAVIDTADSDELDEERFAVLAGKVDPLWRELTGAFASELNKRFEHTRIPVEHSDDFLKAMIRRFEEEQGTEAVEEFRSAIRKDSRLRAHLRRMGVDPDKA